MKTYTPTTTELEEMGFKTSEEFPSIYIREGKTTTTQLTYSFVTHYFYLWDTFIYPRDKAHLLDMIALFTPHD